MCRRFIITMFVLLLVFVTSANAVNRVFTNVGGDRIWNNDDNWDTVKPAGTADNAQIGRSGFTGVDPNDVLLVDSNHVDTINGKAICANFHLGYNIAAHWQVEMTGGELFCNGQFYVNVNNIAGMSSTFTQSGGVVNVPNAGKITWIGAKQKGTYNLSDGTLNCGSHVFLGGNKNTEAEGIFNQTGGKVNIHGILNMPN